MIDRSEMEKRFYVSSFDGLRAIGILSIIIYHLYSYRLQGGFLGLDIFLILAGYFMTNRLMTSLMNDGKMKDNMMKDDKMMNDKHMMKDDKMSMEKKTSM